MVIDGPGRTPSMRWLRPAGSMMVNWPSPTTRARSRTSSIAWTSRAWGKTLIQMANSRQRGWRRQFHRATKKACHGSMACLFTGLRGWGLLLLVLGGLGSGRRFGGLAFGSGLGLEQSGGLLGRPLGGFRRLLGCALGLGDQRAALGQEVG